MAELIEATQADRDGAVAYWIGLVAYGHLKKIRDGQDDGHWKVQELARKRLATEQSQATTLATMQAREAELVGALEYCREQATEGKGAFVSKIVRRCATAIRSASDERG